MAGYKLNVMLPFKFQKVQDFDGQIFLKNENGEDIDITEIISNISDKVTDLTGKLLDKVDRLQGRDVAGNVLVVNSSGYVTTEPLYSDKNEPTSRKPFTYADQQRLSNPIEYGWDVVPTTQGYLKSYQMYSYDPISKKKKYFETVIDIPRDMYLKDVEVLEVSPTHPLPGYENGKYFRFIFMIENGAEKEQILPVGSVCDPLKPGDHIEINNDIVTAVNFVPQYDSVDKVLPGEDQFQYIGETTEDGKWVQDFFYRKKEISKPETTTQQLSYTINDGQYIEIYEDWHSVPAGKYYQCASMIPAIGWTKRYDMLHVWRYNLKSTSDGLRWQVCYPVQVGDHCHCLDDGRVGTVVSISSSRYKEVYLDNGVVITLDGGAGGGKAAWEPYVSEAGDVIFYHQTMQSIVVEIREVENQPYCFGYYDTLTIRADLNGQLGKNYKIFTYTGDSKRLKFTYTETIGKLVEDWVQTDVQPNPAPDLSNYYTRAEIDERINPIHSLTLDFSTYAQRITYINSRDSEITIQRIIRNNIADAKVVYEGGNRNLAEGLTIPALSSVDFVIERTAENQRASIGLTYKFR